MNSQLMLAVLSMDAYNRGYNAGLAVPGTSIGNAAVLQDSSILRDSNNNRIDIPVRFYAVAYSWNGETVISFRGTDNLSGGDFWYGYGTGAGSNSTQAELAAEFYRTVNASAGTASVTLTGHSLGAFRDMLPIIEIDALN